MQSYSTTWVLYLKYMTRLWFYIAVAAMEYCIKAIAAVAMFALFFLKCNNLFL